MNKFAVKNISRLTASGICRDITIFLVLVALVFFIWKLNFYFIFWDEWVWLGDFVKGNFNFFAPFNDHFKPLFKLVYFGELFLFRENQIYSHYILLVAHASVGFLIYKITNNLINSKKYALASSLIFLIAPYLSGVLYANFSLCIILNMAIFLASIFCIQKYFSSQKTIFITLSYILCFLQNYFYSNGLALPLLCIIYYWVFRSKEKKYPLLIYWLIFGFNILAYFYFTKILYSVPTNKFIVTDIPQIINYFFSVTVTNLVRSLSLLNSPSFTIIIAIFSLFLISVIVLLSLKSKIEKLTKILIFLASFYFIPLILISLGRFQFGIQQSFEPRYEYYYLVPLAIYIGFFMFNIHKNFKAKKLINIVFILLFVFYIYFSLALINNFKTEKQNLYLDSYAQLIYYIKSGYYIPNLKDLYPDLTTKQMRNIYLKLNNHETSNDINYQLLEKNKYIFSANLGLIPYDYTIVNPTVKIYQTFYSPYGNLSGVSLYINTLERTIKIPYTFSLLDQSCQITLSTANINIDQIKNDSYSRIVFKEIEDSENKNYCFTITPIVQSTSDVETPIVLRTTEEGKYPLGDLKINGKNLYYDIVFKPLYKYDLNP